MGATNRDAMLAYASPETSVPFTADEDFTFDKEFFLVFNKDTDPAIMEAIDTAMAEIYDAGDIQKRQIESFFIPNYRPLAEAQQHLTKKRDDYEGIISELKAK